MDKLSKYAGSDCQRCGSARALWPDAEPDELHCVFCGACYYLVPVKTLSTRVAPEQNPSNAPIGRQTLSA